MRRFPMTFASPLRMTALLAIILLCLPVMGQTTGTLLGTVSDQTDAAVANAKVTLLNEKTGDVRETETNQVGRFTFAGVRPGTYTIKVASEKFKTWQRVGFAMSATDTRDLSDIKLEVGAMSENVTVEANNALVDLVSNGERSALLDEKAIERLPLIGRNVTELLKTLPGVSPKSGSGQNSGGGGFDFTLAQPTGSPIGAGLTANGSPYRGGTMLLLDGANIIDIGCNCWSIAVPEPEFTQEVKVQTSNFGADQPNGPVVFAATSKSGGNKYHGSAYFSARNNALNSLKWSDAHNWKPGNTKPSMAWYYPGGTFGGPVPGTKGKLMFWGAYEYWWQKLGAGGTITSWVPTASMRAGNFSLTASDNAAYCAGGASATNSCANLGGTVLPNGTVLPAGTTQLPASAIDPNMVALMKAYFPEPNADPSNGYNWYVPVTAQQNGYVWRTRVDYNISESTKLFVSYQRAYTSYYSPTHIWWQPGNSVLFPGGGINAPTTPQTVTANFLHVFSPTLTNEMVVSYAKSNGPFKANDLNAASKSTVGWGYRNVFGNGNNDPLIPGVYSPGDRTFPEMSQPDIFSLTGGQYPMLKTTPTFQDNASKVYKNHTFKMGFYYAMPANQQGGFNRPNGIFNFGSLDVTAMTSRNVVSGSFYGSQNPLANLLMGVATGYSEDNQLPLADQAYRIYSFYGMDDWKLNKRLTVNVGLRFDHIGRWYERTGTGMAVWLPGLYQQDVDAGRSVPGLRWHGIDPGIPISGTQATALLASPRFGLSWDIFGDGKTVLRGGWGVYRYNDEPAYGAALAAAQQLKTYNLPSGTILASQIGPGLLTSGASGGTSGNVSAADPTDHKVPYTRAWNLTISRQLPWRSLLEVAYVGNTSGNLLLGGQSDGAGLSGNGYINANKIPLGGVFANDPVTGAARSGSCVSFESTSSCGTWDYTHYFPLWQGYGQNNVLVLKHGGYANYNALQIGWGKTQGALTFNANFTWGKALGIVSGTVDAFKLDNNYGVLSIDRPRAFNLSYAYDIGNRYKGVKVLESALNGWTVSGFTTYQSGTNIQSSYSSQNLGLSLYQPNGTTGISTLTMYGTNVGMILPVYTCNPNSGVSGTTYINQSCISAPSLPAAGSAAAYGDRQAPYLAGPAFFNQDLSLRKTFKITERQNIQFGFNASNFFNHANWYPTMGTVRLRQSGSTWVPNTVSTTDSNYGKSVNKDGQRVLMLSLKYSF